MLAEQHRCGEETRSFPIFRKRVQPRLDSSPHPADHSHARALLGSCLEKLCNPPEPCMPRRRRLFQPSHSSKCKKRGGGGGEARRRAAPSGQLFWGFAHLTGYVANNNFEKRFAGIHPGRVASPPQKKPHSPFPYWNARNVRAFFYLLPKS